MDRWGTLGRVTKITQEEPLHTITSLSFFDRLKPPTPHAPLRPDGQIKKCLDEYVDGFVVSDELRKCLLMEECESYDLFSKADRREFIFMLFKSVALGGRLCQFEDEIGAYLETTKKLYKDLMT
ncbi:hypothetical protein HDU67_006061, partial [Dinochytrium kinnereticum]